MSLNGRPSFLHETIEDALTELTQGVNVLKRTTFISTEYVEKKVNESKVSMSLNGRPSFLLLLGRAL